MNCSNGRGSRTETANVPSGGSDLTLVLPATFFGIFEVESVRGREERGESRGSGGAGASLTSSPVLRQFTASFQNDQRRT